MIIMNERIKELAEQAGLETGLVYGNPEGLQKFADLVVKECADIALKSGNIANKNIAAKIESERIYQKIKEHFGVEE